jgi:hypothetical protein
MYMRYINTIIIIIIIRRCSKYFMGAYYGVIVIDNYGFKLKTIGISIRTCDFSIVAL